MTDDAAVVVRDLTKVYGPLPRWMRFLSRSATKQEKLALDGVDLTVARGTICAVVGPNGAGKSTLFRVLMGLTTPTSGSAHVLGLDCSIRGESRRTSIGYMPSDERSLLLRLSSRENLAFQAQLRGFSGAALRERVAFVLDLVGLSAAADTAAFALSSGMKARLQLARALVHDPTVLILDEPTSAIDPVAADDLLRLIKRLTEERSLAILLSSHRLEEIDALDDSVVLLDRGRVAFSGRLDSLRSMVEGIAATIGFADEAAAARGEGRLAASPLVTEARRAGTNVEVVATTTLGGVMAALGEELADVVHVDEHSSSTRGILRSVYESELQPGAAP